MWLCVCSSVFCIKSWPKASVWGKIMIMIMIWMLQEHNQTDTIYDVHWVRFFLFKSKGVHTNFDILIAIRFHVNAPICAAAWKSIHLYSMQWIRKFFSSHFSAFACHVIVHLSDENENVMACVFQVSRICHNCFFYTRRKMKTRFLFVYFNAICDAMLLHSNTVYAA